MNTSTANSSVTLNLASPSWVLVLSLSFLYLLSVICVLSLAIPIWLKIIASTALVFIGINAIKRHALFKSDASIISLVCLSEGKCKIKLNNGKQLQVKLVSADILFDYFVAFSFKNNANIYKATIAKDTISQDQFYALRLYLRSIKK